MKEMEFFGRLIVTLAEEIRGDLSSLYDTDYIDTEGYMLRTMRTAEACGRLVALMLTYARWVLVRSNLAGVDAGDIQVSNIRICAGCVGSRTGLWGCDATCPIESCWAAYDSPLFVFDPELMDDLDRERMSSDGVDSFDGYSVDSFEVYLASRAFLDSLIELMEAEAQRLGIKLDVPDPVELVSNPRLTGDGEYERLTVPELLRVVRSWEIK